MINALYVDDDRQLLEVGKLFLERSGKLLVDIVSSGNQAIGVLEQKSYDAIISDFEMPEMNGIELLKVIRESHNMIPFILFTGRGREEVVIDALNNGADSYIQKGGDINAQFRELENSVYKLVQYHNVEIALKKYEKQYRLLMDNAQEGIFVIQNEKVVFYNPKFIDLSIKSGLIKYEIFKRSIFDFIHPDDKEVMRKRFYHRIQTGETPDRCPFRIIDNQGSVHWFEVDAVVTEWNDSPATLNFLRDITEQHNLEVKLVDSLPKTILEMDKDLNLTFINKAGIKKFGYCIEDLKKPLSVSDLVIPSDREKILAQKFPVINEENIPSQEYTALIKDGNTFPMKIYISPFFRENSFSGYRAVCVDITEEKLAKNALLQTNKQLNLMTNITRHDILNKVTALYGLQDILLELSNDHVLTEYLEKQKHITKIIQEHIEFTKLYQEIGLEAPHWHDLRRSILSAISKIDTTVISIQVKVHDYLIYADQLLNNVFLNIIENSIQHGDHVTKIIFNTKETEDELILIYMDDGIGVPDEKKKRIFEEGYGNHTGFGLFLTREILSITGISIKENGTYGSGVKFMISVPKEGYKTESIQP